MPSPNRRKETGWHSLTPNLARKGRPEGSFLPWREQESTTTSKRDQQVPWEMASFPMVLRLPCPIRGHWCIRAVPIKGTLPQKEVRSLRKPLCPHGPEIPLSHQEGNQAASTGTAPLQKQPVQETASIQGLNSPPLPPETRAAGGTSKRDWDGHNGAETPPLTRHTRTASRHMQSRYKQNHCPHPTKPFHHTD